MIWLMVAYALALFYFAAHPAKIANRKRFRIAWILFGLIPFTTALFTMLRTFTIGFTQSGAALEFISSSLSWCLLGASLMVMLKAILPQDKEP